MSLQGDWGVGELVVHLGVSSGSIPVVVSLAPLTPRKNPLRDMALWNPEATPSHWEGEGR